ncbi:MAG: tetratricopeptide repeat protein [Vicinamibacteria bacterium]|nr:tetratricopeptide repeat protein [Vicinamibacteria bacterium]
MPALIPPATAVLAVLALGVATALPVAGQSRPPDEVSSPARLRYDAVRAFREGRYTDAIDLTRTLPADADVHLLRGLALSAIGRYDQGAAAFGASMTLSPRGDAQLELGQLHLLRGRTAEARRLLEPLVAAAARSDDGQVLGRAARAAYRLGRYEQANTLFRDAAALIGDDAALQITWGELFLDKQNRAEAVWSFRAALQSDRRNAAAFAGLARAFADENSATARELVARALSLNTSLVPAYLVLADLALDEDHRDEARTAVEQALAVNPLSLEALSRKAAIALLDDRTAEFETLAGAVLAINPRYGDVYRLAGAQAARHYRFDAAAGLARKALEIEPGNVRASADLGVHLLRTGDEPGARAALDTAFRADPYDVVTYNLLGLLDSLERFETVDDGVVTMRLHPDEAPVLREHALPLARLALDTLATRYGHTVDGRVLVEIFPKHDDFAVRNVGLPGMVGALGACFGRVVTLDSPRARPPGTFNWQATLWHEMAHVITLQMSNNRIPRWLTEGISVFEEQRARPEWGREMELRFADALERGEILPLADLNRGFMSGETIALAYFEASLLVDHLVMTRGEPALQALVRAFADGVSVDEAMRRAVGPTLAEIEPEFVASVTERFAAVLAARRGPEDLRLTTRTPRETIEALAAEYPGNADLQLRLGDARAAVGDDRGAFDAWEHAAYLLPSLVGNDSPLARIANLASGRGDTARASDALERLLARDDTNIEAARRLAALVDPSREPARAARAWERVAELDPFDATASAALGRHALDTSAPDVAARWFRAALAAGPVDKAAAYCDLAESYLAVGAAPQARRQVLAALEVAPSYARAQDLLLTLVDGGR